MNTLWRLRGWTWVLAVAACSGATGSSTESATRADTGGSGVGATSQLVSWGANTSGQLGVGAVSMSSNVPVVVTGVPRPKQLAAGGTHSLLLAQDGHVWAWGANTYGQIGVGPDTPDGANYPTPVMLPAPDDVRTIAAGAIGSAAIRSDGSVWVWGDTYYGELGASAHGVGHATPTQIVRFQRADGTLADGFSVPEGTRLVFAGSTLFALQPDGVLWGWGATGNGQLQIVDPAIRGEAIPRIVPLALPSGEAFGPVDDVGSGYATLLVRRQDGSVWAYGSDYLGQFGDGVQDATVTATLRRVPGLPAGMRAVAVGGGHALALGATGCDTNHVWGWGYTPDGQAGVSSLDLVAPTRADSVLDGSTLITAGQNSSLALRDGLVYQWGRADFGELGQDVHCCSAAPLAVPGLSAVTLVAEGSDHTLAYGAYVPATCGDGVRDGDETDVDCGGATGCRRCDVGQACVTDADCVSEEFCFSEPGGHACGPG